MKDVQIDIKSTQETENGSSVVEMTTMGTLDVSDKGYSIVYHENEENGMEGSITTLEVLNEKSVTLSRKGEFTSNMIIETGLRHLCHYSTPYGDIMLGISTEYISNKLNDHGGTLGFKYDIDVNSSLITRNKIDIQIKESKISYVKNS